MNRLNKNISKNEEEQIYRLSDIQAEEVSIVSRGANKRKFVIVKNDDQKTLIETLQKAQDGDEKALKEILSELFKGVSDTTLEEMGLQRIPEANGDSEEEDEEPTVDKSSDTSEDTEDKEDVEKNTDKSNNEIEKLQDKINNLTKEMKKYKREVKANQANSQSDADHLEKNESADHSYSTLGLTPLNE